MVSSTWMASQNPKNRFIRSTFTHFTTHKPQHACVNRASPSHFIPIWRSNLLNINLIWRSNLLNMVYDRTFERKKTIIFYIQVIFKVTYQTWFPSILWRRISTLLLLRDLGCVCFPHIYYIGWIMIEVQESKISYCYHK